MSFGNKLEDLPHEMLTLPHWIMWKLVEKKPGSKPSKVPYYATNSKPRMAGSASGEKQGSDTDRENLVTYFDAVNTFNRGGFDGIGFCLLPGDGDIVGVDIDNCVTYIDGVPVFDESSRSIMDLNPGYWEFSPSGKGVHGFFVGTAKRGNWGFVETYQDSQFLTWTENIITPCDHLKPYTKIPGTDDKKHENSAPHEEDWFRTTTEEDKIEVQAMLKCIPSDCSNDEWVAVAMAIKSGFGDDGLDIFKEWSGTCQDPEKLASEEYMEQTYSRLGTTGGRTLGSLNFMARTNGWQPPKPDASNWRDNLIWTPEGENGEPPKLMKIDDNLELILKYDEGLPRPAFNELTSNHEMRGDVPWKKRQVASTQPVRDDYAAYRRYISQTHRVQFSIDLIETVFRVCARDNSYSPVVDYLESVVDVWDGKSRVDTWLVDYLGCEDNAYYREVGRLILNAAATRAIHPGCKFDYVTIIEGPQGTGKSTLLDIISKGFFTSDETTLEGKDAMAKFSRYWIIEMCEMSGLKFADMNKLKAIITRNIDSYRPPYERNMIDVKRSSIFMGTTNDSEYLKDSTGNRRYLPIKQGKGMIKLKELRADVDQLWGEIMSKHDSKLQYKLMLSRYAEDIVDGMRTARTYEDPDLPDILQYITSPIPENFYAGGDESKVLVRRTRITTKELSEQILRTDWNDLKNADRHRLNGILKNMSFLTRGDSAANFGRFGTFRYYDIDFKLLREYSEDLYKKAIDLTPRDNELNEKDAF